MGRSGSAGPAALREARLAEGVVPRGIMELAAEAMCEDADEAMDDDEFLGRADVGVFEVEGGVGDAVAAGGMAVDAVLGGVVVFIVTHEAEQA